MKKEGKRKENAKKNKFIYEGFAERSNDDIRTKLAENTNEK